MKGSIKTEKEEPSDDPGAGDDDAGDEADDSDPQETAKPLVIRLRYGQNDAQNNSSVGIWQDIYVESNNGIKKLEFDSDQVAFVDQEIRDRLKEETGYTYRFKLGFRSFDKFTLACTDEYGQKQTITLTVGGIGEEGQALPCEEDGSLPVPGYGGYGSGASYCSVVVKWPDTIPEDGLHGFLGEWSMSQKFDTTRQAFSIVDSRWNSQPYCQCRLFYKTMKYFRAREYVIKNGKIYLGSWGKIYEIRYFDKENEVKTSPKYAYDLYLLSSNPLYDGIDQAVYIKTDNPDPNSLGIYPYDSVQNVGLTGRSEGYCVARTYTVQVRDYDADEKAFFDQLIEEHTYCVCPLAQTGEIGELQMIDFNDQKFLYALK